MRKQLLRHLHLAEVHPHGGDVLPSCHRAKQRARHAHALVGILGCEILFRKRFILFPIRHNHKLRLPYRTIIRKKIDFLLRRIWGHINWLVRLEDKGDALPFFVSFSVAVNLLQAVAIKGDEV